MYCSCDLIVKWHFVACGWKKTADMDTSSTYGHDLSNSRPAKYLTHHIVQPFVNFMLFAAGNDVEESSDGLKG